VRTNHYQSNGLSKARRQVFCIIVPWEKLVASATVHHCNVQKSQKSAPHAPAAAEATPPEAAGGAFYPHINVAVAKEVLADNDESDGAEPEIIFTKRTVPFAPSAEVASSPAAAGGASISDDPPSYTAAVAAGNAVSAGGWVWTKETGDAVAAVMAEKGISQKTLAEHVGASTPATVSVWLHKGGGHRKYGDKLMEWFEQNRSSPATRDQAKSVVPPAKAASGTVAACRACKGQKRVHTCDAVRKPFECEYECGFDGASEAVVEVHEVTCTRNPTNADAAPSAVATKDDRHKEASQPVERIRRPIIIATRTTPNQGAANSSMGTWTDGLDSSVEFDSMEEVRCSQVS
jgi:predicted transcriptional regulator